VDDNFDSSELHELLRDSVTAQGVPLAPTTAVLAAGHRRARMRRTGMAAGALAIVAAVPLAASSLAAGNGGGATASATPVLAASSTSATPPLSSTPQVLASGSIDGKSWTVTGVAAPPGLNGRPCISLGATWEGKPTVSEIMTPGGCGIDATVQQNGLHRADVGGGFGTVESIKGGPTLFIGAVKSSVTRAAVQLHHGLRLLDVDLIPVPGLPDYKVFVVSGVGVADEDVAPVGGLITWTLYDAAGDVVGIPIK
jgi:hypothetical protein